MCAKCNYNIVTSVLVHGIHMHALTCTRMCTTHTHLLTSLACWCLSTPSTIHLAYPTIFTDQLKLLITAVLSCWANFHIIIVDRSIIRVIQIRASYNWRRLYWDFWHLHFELHTTTRDKEQVRTEGQGGTQREGKGGTLGQSSCAHYFCTECCYECRVNAHTIFIRKVGQAQCLTTKNCGGHSINTCTCIWGKAWEYF